MDERQPDEPGNSGLIVLGYWQSQGQAVQREEHLEYVCDAPEGKTWFRIVTEAEAIAESQEMRHAVEKHFRLHREAAAKSFKPASTVFFEQAIGLEGHIKRENAALPHPSRRRRHPLATAMLPPISKRANAFDIIIVGPDNSDPYPNQRGGNLGAR